ncbi:MAG: RNA recognition motif domain-containing protein [Endomicrobiales bacterium]
MNIYVGNLAREVTEDDLRQSFGQFGTVTSASIIKDKFTGEPRGFGFVEMASKEEGQAALAALNGKELKGRPLTVNEARPKGAGGAGGGGGRGFGGGGGGRGGHGGGGGGWGERGGGGSRGQGRGKWKGSSW